MQFTQMLVGGAAVVGFLQFAVIEPVKRAAMPAPDPIVVHSLVLARDTIVQDRTVTTSGGKFEANWTAEIKDARGNVVPNCSGSGTWQYAPGRHVVTLSLAEWVGNPDCELPDQGRFQALASYRGGEFGTTARSPIVTIEGAE
jgi:hypothetical protein